MGKGTDFIYRAAVASANDIPTNQTGYWWVTNVGDVFSGYNCYVFQFWGYSSFIVQVAVAYNINQFAVRSDHGTWKVFN